MYEYFYGTYFLQLKKMMGMSRFLTNMWGAKNKFEGRRRRGDWSNRLILSPEIYQMKLDSIVINNNPNLVMVHSVIAQTNNN